MERPNLESIKARMDRFPVTPKACEEWMNHAREEFDLTLAYIRHLESSVASPAQGVKDAMSRMESFAFGYLVPDRKQVRADVATLEAALRAPAPAAPGALDMLGKVRVALSGDWMGNYVGLAHLRILKAEIEKFYATPAPSASPVGAQQSSESLPPPTPTQGETA